MVNDKHLQRIRGNRRQAHCAKLKFYKGGLHEVCAVLPGSRCLPAHTCIPCVREIYVSEHTIHVYNVAKHMCACVSEHVCSCVRGVYTCVCGCVPRYVYMCMYICKHLHFHMRTYFSVSLVISGAELCVCCLLIAFPIPFFFPPVSFMYTYCLLKFLNCKIVFLQTRACITSVQTPYAPRNEPLPMSHQPANHVTARCTHQPLIVEKSGNSALKRVWAEFSSSEENSLSGMAC